MERTHLTDADIVKYYEPWPPNCKKVKIYSLLTDGFREAVVGCTVVTVETLKKMSLYQIPGQKWGLAIKPRFADSSSAQSFDDNECYEGALKPLGQWSSDHVVQQARVE